MQDQSSVNEKVRDDSTSLEEMGVTTELENPVFVAFVLKVDLFGFCVSGLRSSTYSLFFCRQIGVEKHVCMHE